MKVALIEKREGGHLGGTCLNVGCIPTKALLHTAHLLHDAKNGEEFGVKMGEIEFDYPQAAKRREQVVTQLRRGVQGLMKKNKVTRLQRRRLLYRAEEDQGGERRGFRGARGR
jgi:dihydrolipoamide dehydrogenase